MFIRKYVFIIYKNEIGKNKILKQEQKAKEARSFSYSQILSKLKKKKILIIKGNESTSSCN